MPAPGEQDSAVSPRRRAGTPRSEEVRLVDLCTARGVPALRLGETAESCSPGAGTPVDEAEHVHGPAVEVQGLFTLPLAEARAAHEATLPRYFG